MAPQHAVRGSQAVASNLDAKAPDDMTTHISFFVDYGYIAVEVKAIKNGRTTVYIRVTPVPSCSSGHLGKVLALLPRHCSVVRMCTSGG